jgi:hypothetical protein
MLRHELEASGRDFDIHGGGIDLVFPHHENEIAQTRCAFGHTVMANIWMHNGFLQVEGEKMSKSLGNFLTINELLKDWPGDVLRFNMLRTHYRQPIDWTLKSLEESWRILEGFSTMRVRSTPRLERFGNTVLEALADDLNTPKAIAELHALDRPGAQNELGETLKASGLHRQSGIAQGRGCGGRGGGECPHHRPPGRPQGEELGRERPAARRTRSDGHRHQGQQGRHHELGGEAMRTLSSHPPKWRHPGAGRGPAAMRPKLDPGLRRDDGSLEGVMR